MEIKEKNGTVHFAVRVVPWASKSEVIGEHDGALKVRIASPPVDGAANAELIKLLAKTFGVSKSDVAITSGHSSKTKHVAISGIARSAIASVLKAKT